jgi:hexosaminidase
MRKILKAILGFIFTISLGTAMLGFSSLKHGPFSLSDEDRQQITLIPLPAELSLGRGQFKLEANLGHSFKNIATPKLESAIERFYSKLESKTGIGMARSESTKIILDCKNAGGYYPSIHDDESYHLSITKKNIRLTANSETGILYGLESILQLVKEEDGKWILPELELNDKPRYAWRGLMIDVCRHWIPKDVILRNLEAMATLKMNVLHWHLTEYQGFRIESKTYPKLHELGSGGNYYTQEDIKEVIDFAALRGIRVLPEFDLPGHSTSWFIGYPELASAPGPYALDTVFGVLKPVMNPTKDLLYNFLDGFIKEMAGLFPEEYIHIGGDEVIPDHWNENVEIQNFMNKNGMKDYHELQAYFNQRLHGILTLHGKKMVGWDEIIHPDLPKEEIVVQSWRNDVALMEAVKGGNKAVLSFGYYLDYKQAAGDLYKVDPSVVPGTINFEIDSTNWKGWESTLFASGADLEGDLYLFGEGESLKGIKYFMGKPYGLNEIKTEGDTIYFSHETSFGQMTYEIKITGDSLVGMGMVSGVDIQLRGLKKGGTDMPNGKALPKFEKSETFTTEQEELILGGETCIWGEMVDDLTIESRIWPRACAVAEKLWSPREYTTDNDDLYRRLIVMDDRLEALGLRHKSSTDLLIRDIVEDPYIDPLRTLVDVLREDKFFGRMVLYEPELYTSTPLNRIVDAAMPESYVAYAFNKDVEIWDQYQDVGAKERLIESLEKWAVNHRKLASAMEGNNRLEEIEVHSANLSQLSELALGALNYGNDMKNDQEEVESLLKNAEKAHGGTLLCIVEGMRTLLE